MASISLDSTQQSVAASLYKVFTEQWGCTQAGACGILGNMYAESRLKSGADNPNDKGMQSIGLCQWRDGRNRALKEFAAQNGKNWYDIEAQIGYLQKELTGSYRVVYDTVRSTNSVEEASFIWGNKFEIFQGYKERNGAEHTKRKEYSLYMLNGIKTGSWKPMALSDIPSSGGTNYGDSSGGVNQQPMVANNTPSIYSKDMPIMESRGKNTVHQLASSGSKKNVLYQSNTRKEQFNGMLENMIKNAPELGRDIVRSGEFYDVSILKGDQSSKTERT